MYSQTSRIIWHISIASLIAVMGLTVSGAALAGFGSGPGSSLPDPNPNPTQPGFFDGPVIQHADDFAIECAWRENDGKDVVVGTHEGNISIYSVADLERWKCVTWVKGNLTISPDWDSKGAAGLAMLPWIHAVSGKLTVEASGKRGEFRMPRLYYVGGRLEAKGDGGTIWRSRSFVEHEGTLRATSNHGVDLRGFNWLVELGRLEIHANVLADPNSPGSAWRGLSAVEVIGSLDIYAGEGYAWPEFLESLDVVEGDVEIDVHLELFGISSLREVSGTLDIRVKENWGYGYADGLESLEFVGGDFLWDASGSDLHSLEALASLHTIGGDFEPPLFVQTLKGLESLTHVGGDLTLSGEIDWGEDLAPLASLETVGGRLTIEQFAVWSLNGLEGLQSVGDLRIHANPTLNSVSALHGMTVEPGGAVQVTNNTPLTRCQAIKLVDKIKATGWSGSSDTSGNKYCISIDPPPVFTNPIGSGNWNLNAATQVRGLR